MMRPNLSLIQAADVPGQDREPNREPNREPSASERGSRRFLLATRRDLRGDTTEGNS